MYNQNMNGESMPQAIQPASEESREDKKKEWGMAEAIGEILRLEHEETQPTARIDSETNDFALIRSAVINSQMTPSEGVQKAFDLVHSHRQGEPENPESNQ